MAPSETPKSTIYFLFLLGLWVIILILFPTTEAWIKGYLTARLSDTWMGIVENALRVLWILLCMALVITSVRFVSYLVVRTAYRNTAQGEISSLVRTVLSVIV